MRAPVPLRLTVIVGLLACCSTALAAPQYTATRLDPVDTLWVRVNGINASGQVVAEALTSGAAGAHAVVVSVGYMTDLGTLGGPWSSLGSGINASGQVAGTSYTIGTPGVRAFIYSGGSMTALGTLGGNDSSAAGINPSGQVVGESYK